METDGNVKLGDENEDSSKFENTFSNLGFLRPQYDPCGPSDACGLSVYACGWP